MLFIRRNFKLKTLHMLQNGLIILTFICSLMMMVNFSHDYKRVDFDFPIVNIPYLSSNIPESPAYIWRFCFTVDTLCSGLLEI